MKKIFPWLITAVTLSIIVILLIYTQKITKPHVFIPYVSKEMGFQIEYPTNWHAQTGRLGDGPRTPYTTFSGNLFKRPWSYNKGIFDGDWDGDSEQCPTEYSEGSLDIQTTDHFSHATFGEVNTLDDIRKFFETKGGVKEEIPMKNGSVLIVGRAYTGVGMCNSARIIAWTISPDAMQYHLSFSATSDEDSPKVYPFIQQMLRTFTLLAADQK